METPICRAAYRRTCAEAVTAMQRHMKAQMPMFGGGLIAHARFDKKIAWWGSLSLLLGSAVALSLLPTPVRAGDDYAVSLCLWVPFVFVWWLADLAHNAWKFHKLRREFRQAPGADQMVEFEVSGAEVKHWQRDLYYSAESWKNFVLVAEATDGFLFYTDPRTFYWLPFSAFDTPQAVGQVRAWAQSGIVHYQKV